MKTMMKIAPALVGLILLLAAPRFVFSRARSQR